jgi:hypothetical protein
LLSKCAGGSCGRPGHKSRSAFPVARQAMDANTWKTTECKNSKQCSPAKHHFDECVERVTNQESEGGAKEDCVEECTYKPVAQRSKLPEAWPPETHAYRNECTNIKILQSSTSLTAPPSAPLLSSGPSSNKHLRPANSPVPALRSSMYNFIRWISRIDNLGLGPADRTWQTMER